MDSPRDNKQSRYFQFLQSNSTLDSISPSQSPTKSLGSLKLDTDISNIDNNNGSVNNYSPLKNGFMSNSAKLSNSSSPTLKIKRFSSQNYYNTNSNTTTPSPTKRFNKNRLNNIENRDYSNDFIIPSPSERKNSNWGDLEDLSQLETHDSHSSFFNQPMLSPIDNSPRNNNIGNGNSNSNLFDSPTSLSKSVSNNSFNGQSSPLINRLKNLNFTSTHSLESNITIGSINTTNATATTNTSIKSLRKQPSTSSIFTKLPLNMQIIVNSRAKDSIHDLNNFVNLSYAEFWDLTPEEGKSYKNWNKLEFEIQSLIFEIFTNLKKIKFNLHRLIFIYGTELKNTGIISDTVYNNTFEVLAELYHYLTKFLVKKLKPSFDNKFFVNDTHILKLLTHWFKQLNDQYQHISSSAVYLSTICSNDEVKKIIMNISQNDQSNISNRSAVSPIELFNSYFIKLFTSIQLLFDRLKSLYKEDNNLINYELSDNLENIIKKINNISDSTSELEKKIAFNEKLSYKTEINFSHMEMVNMFDENRKSREPLKLEFKSHNLLWSDSLIAPFDNYLVILSIKNPSTLNFLSKEEEYILSKNPIPLQYLSIDTYIDGDYKILILKDIGSKTSYYFRKMNDVSITIVDRFIKDLKLLQEEFWKSLLHNGKIELKIFNKDNFVSKSDSYPNYDVNLISNDDYNLINLTVSTYEALLDSKIDHSFEPLLTNILSCDYFTRKTSNITERIIVIGTNLGIFMSKASDPTSLHQVHHMKNVKKLTILNNEIIICISNDSLYRLQIEKLYSTYKYGLPPCDINIFEENKRHINDYSIGFQSLNNGRPSSSGMPYLFTWSEKNVYYSELNKANGYKFNWQSFKTHYNIIKLQTVYANNFGISHNVDNSAVWNLSKLSDIRSIGLNNLDIKDILKNEKPIGIFPFPNKTKNISEVLIVFSKFCTRVKNVKGKYIQSTDEIIWFGSICESVSFDCEEKILIAVNKQSVEIRKLFDETSKRSELIGCLLGHDISLINDMPGKAILKCHRLNKDDSKLSTTVKEYENQVIFKIKRCHSSVK